MMGSTPSPATRRTLLLRCGLAVAAGIVVVKLLPLGGGDAVDVGSASLELPPPVAEVTPSEAPAFVIDVDEQGDTNRGPVDEDPVVENPLVEDPVVDDALDEDPVPVPSVSPPVSPSPVGRPRGSAVSPPRPPHRRPAPTPPAPVRATSSSQKDTAPTFSWGSS